MSQPTTPRNDFAPPPPGGLTRALTLALLAHLLLVLALAWGLNWRRQANDPAIMAELWAAPPPPPPQPVRVEPAPTPPRPPDPPPAPPPEPAAVKTPPADLALEQKKKEEAERRAAEEEARRSRIQFERERERQRQQAAEQARQKQEAEKKAAEQARLKQEAEKKEQARRKEEAARQEAARQEAERVAALNRLRQQAGKDSASASGTAPSAGYADKVIAAVYENLVFINEIHGTPVAAVEVRTAPDGTITGRRLTKSSGIKAWDEAVLRAIDKTQTLPRDTDGRIPSPMTITFRP